LPRKRALNEGSEPSVRTDSQPEFSEPQAAIAALAPPTAWRGSYGRWRPVKRSTPIDLGAMLAASAISWRRSGSMSAKLESPALSRHGLALRHWLVRRRPRRRAFADRLREGHRRDARRSRGRGAEEHAPARSLGEAMSRLGGRSCRGGEEVGRRQRTEALERGAHSSFALPEVAAMLGGKHSTGQSL
jgi:hypothetical protein